MNSEPIRLSFVARFCMTLVATLVLAALPKSHADNTKNQSLEVSDKASFRVQEVHSITEQRALPVNPGATQTT